MNLSLVPFENLLRTLVSLTRKRTWRPKTSQSVNCAKEEPNIAAFSETSICNFCWEPELDLDENLDGWVGGRQVGCYFAFYRKLSWKQNYTSLIPSDNDQEKEDEADIVHKKVELWRENMVWNSGLSLSPYMK